MFNMSASMGPKFADTVNEMADRVREFGPSPLRGDVPEGRDEQAEPAEKTEGESK